MTDLFTPTDDGQDELAARMTAAIAERDARFISEGYIPPWIECDSLLNRDERRMLTVISDAGGYKMGRKVVVHLDDDKARIVDSLTLDIGMNADVNMRATLNACREKGYITESLVDGRIMLDVTQKGMYYLEIMETDDWWSEE